MRFGAILPTTEIGNDPHVIRDWAQTAEGLGYEQIFTYDHVVGAVHADREPPLWGPYTELHPFHEPFVVLGFLAGVTTTINLGVAVLVLPQRQAVLVAKQAAEVDVLSGGRLVLAVGTGWNPVEYESLGVPLERRGRRMEEQIEVMRALWREPVIDFTGHYHRVDRAGILPMPVRGDIPLWFGGNVEASLARAARMGDGFVFGSSGERTHVRAARIRELLAENGRDVDSFPMAALIDHSVGPAAWTAEVAAWDGPERMLCVRTMSTGPKHQGITSVRLDHPRDHIVALEEFMKGVQAG